MSRRNTFASVGFFLLCTAQLPAQVHVNGHVTTNVGAGISGVHVILRDTANSHRFDVVSDSTGSFDFLLPKKLVPGVFLISTERLGYEAVEEEIIEVSDKGLEVVLQLDAKPIPVAAVKAVATERLSELDGFRERSKLVKQGAGGYIVERQDLQSAGAQSVARVLTRVPGLVYIPPRRMGATETVFSTRGNCMPRFFLDGVPLVVPDLSFITATSLEGIEVYAAPGDGPTQYSDRLGCARVLMWSRRGEIVPGSRFPLIGVGLMAAITAFLVTR